jgi:hypothetical protein
MKKKYLSLILLIFTFEICAQINCNPKADFSFKPITEGVLLREKPNPNSKILLTTQNPEGVFLTCLEDGLTNDYLKVEINFWDVAYRDNGLNENILILYGYLEDDNNFHFTKEEYFDAIFNEEQLKKIYELLIQSEENDWFTGWSSSNNYDVSTYEGFFNYWIKFDKEKSNYKYIFKNDKKIGYIHKSQIAKRGAAAIILMGANAEYYLEFIEKQLALKKQNSCLYSEQDLYRYLESYINALLDNEASYSIDGDTFSRADLEEKYGDRADEAIEKFGFQKEEKNPYKAIQEINKYLIYFTEEKLIFKTDFLKMKASFLDENNLATLVIGEKLIKAFNLNKIGNSKNNYSGDIDMAGVYNYMIASLLNTNQNEKALDLSEKCLNDIDLQFNQINEFYAISLYNLDQKSKACEVLNKAYLDGNERARNLIKQYCQ